MDVNATTVNISGLQKVDLPKLGKSGVKETDQKAADVFVKNTIQADQEQAKAEPFTKDQAEKIVDNINNMVKMFSGKIEFKVHEETDRVMIRVVDNQTKELIREIPPENVLNANAKFREVLHLVGFMMDEKV